MKVVIIPSSFYDSPKNQAVITSFATEVIPVRYTESMTKEELFQAIGSVEQVTQVAFLYHYPGFNRLPFFYDLPSGQTDLKEPAPPNQPKYHYFSDRVIDIIQTLRDERAEGLKATEFVVDILTCDLKSQEYKEEVSKVETDLSINVRYSVDKTGNPSSGANWTLESEEPVVNVREEYFTEGVLSWTNMLTLNIAAVETATSKNIKAVPNPYDEFIEWNSTTKTYTLRKDFAWSSIAAISGDSDSYITLLDGETFDGNNKVIDLEDITGWKGLFASSGTSFATAPIMKNLGVTRGTTSDNDGFIVRQKQSYFTVENCYSTGSIGSAAGGIAGASTGSNGSCTIINCYSTGSIGYSAGGITGKFSGDNGTCTISNCYSTGPIGIFAGGITAYCAGYKGTCTIENCYSIGDIQLYAGGIAGGYAGYSSGNCNIANCYSIGSIGSDAGGIVGYIAGLYGGTCIIENCVSNSPIFEPASTVTTAVDKLNSTDLTILQTSTLNSRFPTTEWVVGDQVTIASITYTHLPILKAFQSTPWISDSAYPKYYNQATDLAKFNPNFMYPETTLILVQWQTMSNITPVTTDNIQLSYFANLPSGLTINSETGEISGTPTDLSAPQVYTINGSINGAVVATFELTIQVADPVDLAPRIKAGEFTEYIQFSGSTYTVQKDFAWTELQLDFFNSFIGILDGETFDGNGKNIDLEDTTGWQGLFVSYGTSIVNAPLIKNLGIIGGEIAHSTGFIIREQQKFFKIDNCYSTGIIYNSGGGIAGRYAGYNGNCIITNCYSIGSIGQSAGGIVGDYSGVNGFCTITNCYSTGNIGAAAGGIAGSTAARFGICTITNCYSIGNIGAAAGGITGSYAGLNGTCTITNCYSIGSIGNQAGGIVGNSSGINGSSCTIQYCVSNSPTFAPNSIALTLDIEGNETNSTTLANINDALYKNWDTTIWQSGQAVNNLGLPIIKAFQSAPWISDTTNAGYYNQATDPAKFVLPPSFSYNTTQPIVLTRNVEMTPITPNSNTTFTSYSATLPNGLQIDSTTGTISGIPIDVLSQTDYIIAALIGGIEVARFTLSIEVLDPSFSYNVTLLQLIRGYPMAKMPISNISLTYSISPDLPTGLELDTATGEISGIPTNILDSTDYIVTGYYEGIHVSSVTLTISIINDVSIILELEYPPSITLTQNTQMTEPFGPTLATNIDSYSISPSNLYGLTFDTSTGEISGTPTSVTQSAVQYTITGTNTSTGNWVNDTIYITINSDSTSGSGSGSEPLHHPVVVDLNIQVDAYGTVQVFSFTPQSQQLNVIDATYQLPVSCFYDASNENGLIEFWEPNGQLGNIKCRLAADEIETGVKKWDSTARKLASNVHRMFCDTFDAAKATPFNADKYKQGSNPITAYTQPIHFGRLALSLYAHHIFGHAAATAAITNDTEMMKNMLSLDNTVPNGLEVDNTNDGPEKRYDAWKHRSAVSGALDPTDVSEWVNSSAEDANLALRMVWSLISKGLRTNPSTVTDSDTGVDTQMVSIDIANSETEYITSTVNDSNTSSLAYIVKQVLGQDANRGKTSDNNELEPEVHQLLRFYPGDTIYMKVKVKAPTIKVGDGQQATTANLNLEGQDETYVIRVVLREEDAELDAPVDGGEYTIPA